jgi:ATP/maltotriose-dependent transcriptional regulator MalT
MTSWVFAGFQYKAPFEDRYNVAVRKAAGEVGWETVMPMGSTPHGLMLDRIAAMIRSSQRAIYDVTVDNGNVWFELGITLARRQPVALLTEAEPVTLPDILRTPFLRQYMGDQNCCEVALAFLQLTTVPAMVGSRTSAPTHGLTAVIGRGFRTESVAQMLSKEGFAIKVVDPAGVRSVDEAVQVAESAERMVVVRPVGETWEGPESIASLMVLGASYELNRECVLAAAPGEWIPSDCPQLAVRGEDEEAVGKNVASAFRRPRPGPPPRGTTRPKISKSIGRRKAGAIRTLINDHGAAALDSEPGYGKTVMLDQVARDLGFPVAWVTAGDDWSLADLIEAVVAAVGEHVPGFGWDALSTVRADRAQSGERVRERATTVTIVSGQQFGESIWGTVTARSDMPAVLLVIDDIHKLLSEADPFVASMLGTAPAWIRIAIAGRGLPRRVGEHFVRVGPPPVRAGDLAFDAGETESFLRESVPDINPTWVELLHVRTEGWPIALAVIRAWLYLHTDATLEQLQSMTRGDRWQIYQIFVAGYFTSLDPQVQANLLDASLPLRLDDAVAGRLFGEGGGLRLRDLAMGPYFLTEDSSGVFRYHLLFREFLLKRYAEQRSADLLRSARTELARWYLERRDTANAYQVAVEAEDWETAADAIEPISRLLASHGDGRFLMDILGRLPEATLRGRYALWESWARALSYMGDARALDELNALANSSLGDKGDHAIAQLLSIEAKYERGLLSDSELAGDFDRIADSLGDRYPTVGVQARLQSLSARSVHNGEASQWPGLTAEAEVIGRRADALNLPGVAAAAYAEAGELATRTYGTAISQEAMQLRVLASMGYFVLPEARAARAKRYEELGQRAAGLLKIAFERAEKASSAVVLAQVQLHYSRYITFSVMQAVWMEDMSDGGLNGELVEKGEAAISYALSAAEAYAERGVLRSMAIALNTAGQAAAAINNHQKRDEYSRKAEEIANELGYAEIAQMAINIRSHPTAVEAYRAAKNPPPIHQESDEWLKEMLDGLLAHAPLTQEQRLQLRPIQDRILADDVYASRLREEICRYLALLMDLTGPRIGPFDTVQPNRSVACRLLGISLIEHHPRGQPLLRKFTSAFCTSCAFRSPAPTRQKATEDDDEIFAPLRQLMQETDADEARTIDPSPYGVIEL